MSARDPFAEANALIDGRKAKMSQAERAWYEAQVEMSVQLALTGNATSEDYQRGWERGWMEGAPNERP
jgi:hypothetical protein